MNFRPAISAPLPWLTVLAGRFLSGSKRPGGERPKTPRFRFPRSLKVTREGWWFMAILFFTGIAAINTGNNLLYLVLATLLSIIIISGLMSESTLKRIKPFRRPPKRIFKNRPAPFSIEIENNKRFLPSISFDLSESGARGIDTTPVYLLKLDAGASILRMSDYTFKRRGRHILTGIKVTTRFPFGLFIKGKVEAVELEVTVYPEVKPMTLSLPGATSPRAGQRVFKRGAGSELHNLRDYTPHDDSRFIHWKSAAKNTGLVVKEFERESEKEVIVRFNNLSVSGKEGVFEDRVDEVAGVIKYFIDSGYSVSLQTVGVTLPGGAGDRHFFSLLNHLAVIKPAGPGAPSFRVVYP
ncbi:MAG: DUF58 domain-containing protein [Thermodesulfobacteriota bacterium]|nr:MAG: DUF58 domain-containing protein [Thermodesulfobacteriota bacterium]